MYLSKHPPSASSTTCTTRKFGHCQKLRHRTCDVTSHGSARCCGIWTFVHQFSWIMGCQGTGWNWLELVETCWNTWCLGASHHSLFHWKIRSCLFALQIVTLITIESIAFYCMVSSWRHGGHDHDNMFWSRHVMSQRESTELPCTCSQTCSQLSWINPLVRSQLLNHSCSITTYHNILVAFADSMFVHTMALWMAQRCRIM